MAFDPFRPVKYLLRVESTLSGLVSAGLGDIGGRAIELPLVSSISRSRVEATTLTWTLSAEPFREPSGLREEEITLSGRSGLTPRLGADRQGALLYGTGPELFQELEEFLRSYQSRIKRAYAEGTVDGIRLVFSAPWEGIDVYVEPGQVRWVREVGASRHSYAWTLTLRAYGDATPGPFDIFEAARSVANYVRKVVNSVTAYIALGTRYAKEVNSVGDAFRGIIWSGVSMMTEVRNAIGELSRAVRMPQAVVEDAFRVAEQATLAAYDAYTAIPGVPTAAGRRAFVDALETLGDARRSALEALGASRLDGSASATHDQLRGTTSAALMAGSGADSAAPGPVTTHVLSAGETLHDVAQAYLGDAERWPDVAVANGLPDPYHMASGAQLVPGTVLIIPTAAVPPSADHRTDLLLSPSGDLVVAGSDLAVVSGLDNLLQALSVRLRTERGESPWPAYGVEPMVGDSLRTTAVATAVASVRSQALADPRVSMVQRTGVQDRGDAILVECDVVPVTGTAFTVLAAVA
ncbi:MAG: hypothetical protein AMXMBFR64_45800 [Myxococcales bacterium]